MIISIWLVPDTDDEQYLKTVIEDLSSQNNTPSFTPHLTLLGDVKTTPEELINIVNEVFENVKKFNIEVQRINQSDTFTKTVYLDIIPNETLTDLFKKVSTRTDNRSIDTFKPHMSLIYKQIPENDRLKIINNLNNIKSSFRIGKAVVVDNKKATETIDDVKGWIILYEKRLS